MPPKTKPVHSLDRLKLIESIKAKAVLVSESKQNVNHLIELIDSLGKVEESDVSDAAQRALTKVFTRFLQTKDMVEEEANESKAIDEYRTWLRECYLKTKQGLWDILSTSTSASSQELALVNSMKLLSTEGKYPLTGVSLTSPYFPFEYLKSTCACLLSTTRVMAPLIARYQEYIEYQDVKYQTLKSMLHLLKHKKENPSSEETETETTIYVTNVYNLLSLIRFPILGKTVKKRKVLRAKGKAKAISENPDADGILLCDPINVDWPRFKLDYEKAADLFASVWLQFLSFKIPVPLYRRILLVLDEEVMPHFRNPLSLTDFLIDSFSVGGSVSLLSLSSLFILIQKCNLEYPDFYLKLYSMVEPNILYVKYRARFFFWTDIFLSSSHLPSYMVAAFVKRLSRMALFASADALLILLPLIGNLLVRHQSLLDMVSRPDAVSIGTDPFIEEEEDPAKSHALESSLWEVKSLQNHWHPKVSAAASFINKQLPSMEWDLSDVLETNFEDLVSDAVSYVMAKDLMPKIDANLRDDIINNMLI